MALTPKELASSLKEILARKKEGDVADSKPKFMSKAQREAIANRAREEELAAEKAKAKLVEDSRKQFFDLPKEDKHRKRGSSRDRQNYDRRDEASSSSKRKRGETESAAKKIEEERQKAYDDTIKTRYCGKDKEKKKRTRKVHGRTFNFSWDECDDTSKEYNKLYQDKHEIQFFGRGTRAGFDSNDTKNKTIAQRNDAWYDQHWKDKPLSAMQERDWRIFREDFSITVKAGSGGSVPKPIRYWKEANLPKSIIDVILKIGYKEPTPIQRQAIPIGLVNRDIIGVAETGSGKTAAFLIPLLVWLTSIEKEAPKDVLEGSGPYAVIMAPTRELAQQIEQEAIKFGKYLGIKTVSIIGGASKDEQGYVYIVKELN
uniref:RNA helicase n=1 Tax=Rhabditophanes sp. KR3021 TaxID=114890 RepID=A0AC35TT63_9BILA